MIHCAKCKTVNGTDLNYCKQCRANLLPGEGLGTRIAYLFAAGLVTAVGVFVLVRILNEQVPPDLDCMLLSPVFWGLLVVISPLFGLVQALRPTPHHQRYLNRAKRHSLLDPEQSLADLNQALALAPGKARAEILKERARLYEKLGLQKLAVRDQLTSTQEEGAFQGGELFAGLAGLDSDSFVGGLRSGVQKSLLKSGDAVALGYCSKCKDAVLLDEGMHCLSHKRSKIQEVRFSIPEEVDQTRSEILVSRSHEVRRLRLRRAVSLVALFVLCGGLIFVFNLFPSTPQPERILTEEVAQGPLESESPVQPDASLVIFDDHGFVFEYPGSWKIIQQSDIDVLLNSSLEGLDIDQAEYIGGVYTGGLDNCWGCAQIVIVAVRSPGMSGPLTDEQYENAKQANQERIGDRLIAYNKITIDSLTGTESKHLGRSGESQLWEFILLPPQPGMIYLFSMSSSIAYYEQYEPQFQVAVDTLQIDAGQDRMVIEEEQGVATVEVAVVELPAVVLNESINLRAGPGKSYGIVGSLEKGQEILVSGRNEGGDWFCFDTGEGAEAWVYGPLVSVQGDILELPVEEIEP